MPKYAKIQHGFTLMEVLVSTMIIVVILIGIYGLIILSLQLTSDNKGYVEAMEIAKQQIEYVHSLSYKNVGVIAGNPGGVLEPCKTVSRGGSYEVCSSVKYEDDEFDGLITDIIDPDTNSNDYKLVTIKVSWETRRGAREISVYTKVVPSTLEVSANQGLLRILVTDSGYLNSGNIIEPVAGAKVSIYNPITGFTQVEITDSDGLVNILATTTDGYEITVTHNAQPGNYSTDMTYGTSTNKTPQHLSVLEGKMTYEQFTIDKKGLINIKTAKASNLPQIWQVNNAQLTRSQKNLKVGKDGSNYLYFVWQSESSTSTHVYAQKYDTVAQPVKQWANDVRISDTYFQENPDIAVGNNFSYVVWQDNSITLRKTAYHPSNRFVFNKQKNLQVLAGPALDLAPSDDPNTYRGSVWHNFTNYFSGLSPAPFISTTVYTYDNLKTKLLKFFESNSPLTALAAGTGLYGLKVQKYVGEIAEGERKKNVMLTDSVDPDHAFVLMHSWWSTAIKCLVIAFGGCQPDEHQATAHLDPSGMQATIERSGIPNPESWDERLYFSFYVIEAQNNEFVVRDRDSLTILYDTASTSEFVADTFTDPNKLTVFSNSRMEMDYVDTSVDDNYLGYATAYVYDTGSEWRVKAERGGIATDNYNSIVRYEIVEWLSPLVTVQSGEIAGTIGTTEGTFDLAASPIHDPVNLSRTWLYGTMFHKSSGLAQTSVRIRLIDNNTIGYHRAENSYDSTIRWWTIEFPRGVEVQRGSDQADSADTEEYVGGLSPVALENSWSDSYRTSHDTDNEFPLDRWTETLNSSTELKWWRRSSGEETYFYYQVIDTSDWDRPVEVIATGTQVSTLNSTSTNAYLGGGFIITKENHNSKIDSITISEHGTADAENYLKNIKLRYDTDNTLPYDCVGESYNTGDSLFGSIDADGFSAANGTSTFIHGSGLTVSASSSICLYVELDVLTGINKYDTVDIKINNPRNDIILAPDTGYILETSSVLIPGSTELLLPPIPEQLYYVWREDDGGAQTASTYSENSFIIKKPGEVLRLRLTVNNAGSKLLATAYTLKYGLKTGGTCASIAVWTSLNPVADWYMFDSSYLEDGTSTEDFFALTNPNTNFISGYIQDQAVTTGNIDLSHEDFTEIEYSIVSDTALEDAEYCFRLEKQGDNSSFAYIYYPEVTIIGDYNIYIKKINNSDGTDVWASPKQVNTNESPEFDRLGPRVTLIEYGGSDYPVVSWYDTNNNIFAQKLDTNGNLLWNAGKDLPISSTTAIEQSPSLALDSSSNIIIAWSFNNNIYLNKYSSTTGASLWTSSTTIASGADNFYPEISIDSDDYYYIAYEKNSGGQDAYLSKYSSTTAHVWTIKTNITSDSSAQTRPALMIDNLNSFVYVSWADDRLGNSDIYVQKIDLNTSAHNWTEDYRINFDTGGDNQYRPYLIMRGNDPVAAWQDNSLALAAKFRPEGQAGLIPEPNINLNATSSKTSSDSPPVPKITEIFQSDANGDATIYLEYDFDGYYFIAAGGDSIYITDPAMPIALEPDQAKNIVLYIN